MTTKEKGITIKLLVDKKANKVVFAEAKKDFIDFLLSLLTLPVSSTIKLITEEKMAGCITNLHDSVKNLEIQPSDQGKDVILNPKAGSLKYYTCTSDRNDRYYYDSSRNSHPYITDDPSTPCPQCKNAMSSETSYVGPKTSTTAEELMMGRGDFVKGVVTYMVKDSLEVIPMSVISCISLFNDLNIQDFGSLQEMVVDLGMVEVVALIRTSLQSKTVLSEVFLWNEIEVQKMFV